MIWGYHYFRKHPNESNEVWRAWRAWGQLRHLNRKKKTDFSLPSCDARYIAVILDVLKKGDTTPKGGQQHLPNDSRVTLPRSVLKERYTLISLGLLLITNECFPGRNAPFIQYFFVRFSSFKQTPWFWIRSMQNSFTRCIPWMLRVVLRKAGSKTKTCLCWWRLGLIFNITTPKIGSSWSPKETGKSVLRCPRIFEKDNAR